MVQVVGVGESVEASAFWNHAIIVGYYDTLFHFMPAAISPQAATFSGNPSLYYSKFSWRQLDIQISLDGIVSGPTVQQFWRERESLSRFHCYPYLSSKLIFFSRCFTQLGGPNAAGGARLVRLRVQNM